MSSSENKAWKKFRPVQDFRWCRPEFSSFFIFPGLIFTSAQRKVLIHFFIHSSHIWFSYIHSHLVWYMFANRGYAVLESFHLLVKIWSQDWFFSETFPFFVKLQLVVVSKKLDIFALLFFSYAWALKRDYDRLEEVSKRVDVNPLGRLVLTWLCKEAWGGGNWQEGGLEGGNCVGGRSDTYFIVLLMEYKLKGIGLNSSWCHKSSSTGKYILWACHKTHPYLWVMRAFIKNNMINRQLTNQLTNWLTECGQKTDGLIDRILLAV